MSLIHTESPEFFERKLYRQRSKHSEIFALLDQIKDPEIPVISLWDLGILQEVNVVGDHNKVIVVITPTYSGCPAMQEIVEDIHKLLMANNFLDHQVETRLTPAWTTDWMSNDGKEQLRKYGIAPPRCHSGSNITEVECPQCRSSDVKLVSEFGSTSCKALYQCQNCHEPFDYFKCI